MSESTGVGDQSSYRTFDTNITEQTIDVSKNGSLFLQIRARERDSWHKIWFYGFLVIHTILLVLLVVVVKLAKNKKLRRYIPPLKFQ